MPTIYKIFSISEPEKMGDLHMQRNRKVYVRFYTPAHPHCVPDNMTYCMICLTSSLICFTCRQKDFI